MQSPVDLQFFSRLGQDVKTELKREKDLERRADERQQQVHYFDVHCTCTEVHTFDLVYT